MVKLSFDRCKKSKTIFILEKGRFGAGIRNGSTRIWRRMFLDTLPKTGDWKLLFDFIQFGRKETPYGPKKTLFLKWDELGSLGLRGISPKLKDQPQAGNFNAILSV